MWIEERFLSRILSDSSFPSISVSDNRQKSDLDLYGPTLGFENRIFFCCDSFSLNIRAGGAILWTDADRNRSQRINDGVETIRMTTSSCSVVPAWEIEFGLASGSWCTSCFSFNFEIGYDFQGLLIPDLLYFNDGIQLTSGDPVLTVVFPAQDSNVYLALHGLHARVSVNF